jgi:hypothetical protein
VSAEPALCNRLARRPSESWYADLFGFFLPFSFGDFLGGSGTASSVVDKGRQAEQVLASSIMVEA